MVQRILGLAASFFVFSSFILELFVMIGQLSNKPFLNLIYFLKSNNPQYNLSYGFGLWSYCQGTYNGPVESCSPPKAAFDWYTAPGFSDMLPTYASSRRVNALFLALFILYFIGLIFSFLLWIATLPVSVCCCIKRFRHNPGNRPIDITMAFLCGLNFLIMLVVLILALVLVIGSVKAITGASIYWEGYAGNALWLTIASAASLFLATVCYLFKACCHGGTSYGKGGSSNGIRVSPDNNHAYKSQPFDLTPHQPCYNNDSPMIAHRQPQPQPTLPQPHLLQQPAPSRNNLYPQQQQQQQDVSISSLSQQYSPGLQTQYLDPIYGSHNAHPPPN
ncbi:SUR7/PalI family-domain-containing protein [Parasitella parasitica]|nr:SUR7/PalI family-domain-containing protein [Parasitella parasitica]